MKKNIKRIIALLLILLLSFTLAMPVLAEEPPTAGPGGDPPTGDLPAGGPGGDPPSGDPGGGNPPGDMELVDEYVPVINNIISGYSFLESEKSNKTSLSFEIEASCSDIFIQTSSDTDLTYCWYLDDEVTGSNTKTLIVNGSTLSAGLHSVYCKVSCNTKSSDTDIPHYATSNTATIIVYTGENKEDILLFSDIHEEQTNIAKILKSYMDLNNNKVPGLIIASGDHNNQDRSDENLTSNIAKADAIMGNITRVYLAGNHESSSQIISKNNGTGKVYEDNVIVYTINYDEIENNNFESITNNLNSFLLDEKNKGTTKPIIIASHPGLHNVGNSFQGDSGYNLDSSDKVVELLNSYSENLNLFYFFGHNHSKNNTEIFKVSGDSIFAISDYSTKSDREMTIGFSYGTMGYINSNIGGSGNASVLTISGDNVYHRRLNINGSISESTTVTRINSVIPEISDIFASGNTLTVTLSNDCNCTYNWYRTESNTEVTPGTLVYSSSLNTYSITTSGKYYCKVCLTDNENIFNTTKVIDAEYVYVDDTPVTAPADKAVPEIYSGEEAREEIVINIDSNTYLVGDNSFSANASIFIENGRTYLGVRDMAYGLGIDPMAIKWDDKTKTASISRNGATLDITQGSDIITMTYKGYIYEIKSDASAQIRNDRIYLPFRVIFQIFGYDVNWDSTTRTINCK